MQKMAYLTTMNMFNSWITRSILVILLLLLPFAVSARGETTRVSVSSTEAEGNGHSFESSITADGRYVAFESIANNLVAGDGNGSWDVFVRDTQSGQTGRVSISSAGVQGNGDSYSLRISSNGLHLAFGSAASNLVPGDTNGSWDIFVRDFQSGQTERVSVSSAGVQGNNDSYYPGISSDGRYVVFESAASNLVAGDTNGVYDIFLRDLDLDVTERVSVSTGGGQGNNDSYYPSISSDGRYVVFESKADNLVVGDTNGRWDIFVHDRTLGETKRVSLSSSGKQGNGNSRYPYISSDGNLVAFESKADNLVTGDNNGAWDIFVHDRQSGETTRVAQSTKGGKGKDHSHLSISSDGRYVAFESFVDGLVPDDNNGFGDIFVYDRDLGQITRVSVSSTGVSANGKSHGPYISSNGQYVVFESDADNLVAGDTNGVRDIFKVERFTAITLMDPNGGETIASGSTYTIQWGAHVFADNYKLQYSLNNGKDWETIAKGIVGTTYDWRVPTPTKNKKKCLIKLIGYNASGKKVGVDKSDAPFTIEVVNITSPQNGDTLTSKAFHNITWDTNKTSKKLAKIILQYSTNGGKKWEKIKAMKNKNPGAYQWKVPNVPKTKKKCKVKIQLLDKKGKSLGSDTSNSYFTIEP